MLSPALVHMSYDPSPSTVSRLGSDHQYSPSRILPIKRHSFPPLRHTASGDHRPARILSSQDLAKRVLTSSFRSIFDFRAILITLLIRVDQKLRQTWSTWSTWSNSTWRVTTSRTSSMAFHLLPYDILHELCPFLRGTNPPALMQFSMTSKRNRQAALPVLFARVTFKWSNSINVEHSVQCLVKNPAILTAIR